MNDQEMNAAVEEILKGSFDLHVHAGPDPVKPRRLDAMDTARAAYEAEMAGFVLKSHEYPTTSLAYALNRMYPGLEVVGSVTLNPPVGGLNPEAVQIAADMGARVVWMPTMSADFYLRAQGGDKGLTLTVEDGRLKSEIHSILDIVSRNDMVLASGHVSPSEATALFTEARSKGIGRMMATHPIGIATTDQMRDMVSLGVYPEFTLFSCMPSVRKATIEETVESIRTLGVEGCVVSTDFGQWDHPPPAEGMRMAISALLKSGLSPDEVSSLVKDRPKELVSPG